MPGQYSSHCRTRPCALLPAAATTARLFLCVRCKAQVLVSATVTGARFTAHKVVHAHDHWSSLDKFGTLEAIIRL